MTSIMLAPFVACLVLTGIHTYLGLHVVTRGVIFVDLALAQIAALGSTFAFLLGFEPSSTAGYLYSLGFAFFGAAIFSLSRLRDQRVPQEALIGITFAVASSAAILIADRAPQGAEHVEEMLTGAVLWVTWPTIWKTMAIYAVVGFFHFVFRKRFLLISLDTEEARRRGLSVRWWDFLFYISFGLVITSSVAIAGILLVFSYLIIPSVIGMLYSQRVGIRLVIGWVTGTLVSVAGLMVSYQMDFPSGPSIVCSFGLFLILAALLVYWLRASNRTVALARIALGTFGITALFSLGIFFRPADDTLDPRRTTPSQKIIEALAELTDESISGGEALRILKEGRERLHEGLDDGSIHPDQRAVQRMGLMGDPGAVPVLKLILEHAEDPWLQFYTSEALISLGDPEGVHGLIKILGGPTPTFLKTRVIDQLRVLVESDFGYVPTNSDEENQTAVNQLEVWWHQNGGRLTWDPGLKNFRLGDE